MNVKEFSLLSMEHLMFSFIQWVLK